jgi:hypothetical protein
VIAAALTARRGARRPLDPIRVELFVALPTS